MAQHDAIPDQPSISHWIEWLATYGQTENGGVTRLLYSESWQRAQEAMKELMLQHGCQVRFDEVGNLFGRYPGREQPKAIILTGSHIDTVIDGGKYDGAYGILASMLAAHLLYLKYGPPKKTIEVVSLAEEEGSRFPFTFWGSKWVTGQVELEEAKALLDSNGFSLEEAMKQAGFGQPTLALKEKEKIEAFLEVHIEQGVMLERKQKEIGIVTDIVGQRRYTLQFQGESNHAGTTPMSMRKDALRLAAAFITHVTEEAERLDESLVATIGKVVVSPNTPNVIAGGVECSLDVRHANVAYLDAFEKIVFDYREIAKKQNMQMDINRWLNIKPVHLSDKHVQLTRQQAEEAGFSYDVMVSGAGHDAQVFGTFCPTSLIFVPSHKGISHSPEEYTHWQELEKGVEILKRQLYTLAYE
ncbi:allantoate deiminase [Alkalicoccobacillus porphyridii]|uniref:Allantoate deiminase n=1 Tax=Alkalicoccobacillus porphyridii TaxID=2597270 RepID=A0A554A3P1_9BACI|nr:allantoate deiminase [Alkalicoccobacillus porphyridii]TSB48309.1 allantoate deiminase [Alkalicoccobacillus porphyridii]